MVIYAPCQHKAFAKSFRQPGCQMPGDPAATCVVTGNTLGVTEVLTNGLLRNRYKRPHLSLKTRSSVDQFDGLHD